MTVNAIAKANNEAATTVVRFGAYEADLASGDLRKNGIRIHLRDQSFRVLAALLQHAGRVVSRDKLRRLLWGDRVFVEFENNLNAIVGHLREALCDSADHPRYIETLPKRGYRIIVDVNPALPREQNRERARLLVLPILNAGGDTGQEYFADAITDEIITALAGIAPDRLAVIARTTSAHYKRTHKNIGAIARELQVDYVVEGSVRLDHDHATLNLQLIETGGETHLFARKYDIDMREVFTVEASMAREVVAHLPAITNEIAAPASSKQVDVITYTEYIKGRYEMLQVTPESMERAKLHFETALARDPAFALACDGLANLYGYLGFWGFMPPDEAEPLRWRYALRAFQLDPALAEPRTLVAYRPQKTAYGYTYNWTEAEKEMSAARDLAPNSSIIRVRHAAVLLTLGRVGEAVNELERALELDPLSYEVHFWLAIAFFLGRSFQRGLSETDRLLELDPSHHLAYVVLGWIRIGMRNYDESIVAMRRAVELSRQFPFALGWLGLAAGLAGHGGEARELLCKLHALAGHQFVLPSSFAWIHLGLGEFDQAFAWLKQAVQRNDEWVHPLKTYPFLDPLRSDRRYASMLRQLNLEAE